MPRDPKITPEIKSRLSKLEPQLRKCVKTADIKKAKTIMTDIQSLLRPKGYNSRLMQNKNYFFEVVMEAGEIQMAISGLIGIRKKVSSSSRMYLEATALLAVCNIRKNGIYAAQAYINETIDNINNITSDTRRHDFHKAFLNRVDDEMMLYSLKESAENDIDIDSVHSKSIKLILSKSEDELYKILGECVPEETVAYIAQMQESHLLLIPTNDRLYLPKPLPKDRKDVVGRNFGTAIQRVVWKSLCDQNNDIYKMWSQGLSIVHDKKYITIAIVTMFRDWKIGTTMMAASVAALAIRFGIQIFCEMFEPSSIMEKRK